MSLLVTSTTLFIVCVLYGVYVPAERLSLSRSRILGVFYVVERVVFMFYVCVWGLYVASVFVCLDCARPLCVSVLVGMVCRVSGGLVGTVCVECGVSNLSACVIQGLVCLGLGVTLEFMRRTGL